MNIESILAAAKQRLLYLIGRTPDQIWNRTLNELLRDVDSDQEGSFRVLLDNFHHSAAVNHGSITTPERSELNNSLICIQLAALKRMRCMNLVGFQPMTGPVSQVMSLQYQADDIEPNKLTLAVVPKIAEAKSRKLQLKWSVEAMSDNVILHGLDIKSEIESATAAELALELDVAVVDKIKSMATKLDAEEIRDWRHLSVIINRMGNGIARRSRRGAGNWVILPMDMFTMLQENPNYVHFPEEKSGGLRLMGEMLNTPDDEHGIKIYTDILQVDNTIVVGYKGITALDTGYVFGPYIITVPAGVTTDPDSFQLSQGFLTRYGEGKFNPENYYSSMEVIV